MAAGDEKVDVFDQVRLLNRLSDGGVEIQFDGKFYRWQPGEVRNIPRAYKQHFLQKSTFKWDPTESHYPQRTIVEIDAEGKAVDASQGASAESLTKAEASPLDLIDDSNLPDRYFDPDTGTPLRNKEGRIAGNDPRHFRGRSPAPRPRVELNDEVKQAADAAQR